MPLIVSKHWTPKRPTVELAPSRIRRAPVREPQTIIRRTEEQETWIGAAGVIAIAAVLAIVILGIGVVTIVRDSGPAKPRFGQCYSSGGTDCVIDGDTIRVDREHIQIAGIAAPNPHGAACGKERERGVAAAVGLSALLQSGEVVIGAAAVEPDGREARVVMVNGRDVAKRMLDRGLARPADRAGESWCG
jgi:endonuclease YncB( thermonuclease family)